MQIAKAPAAKAPSGTVTLQGWQVSPAEATKLTKVVKAFEKSHPKIKVNYSGINGDYQTTMLAKFAARQPAGRLLRRLETSPDWARQGVLQPLNAYVKPDASSRRSSSIPAPERFKYRASTSTASRRTGRRSGWRSTPALLATASRSRRRPGRSCGRVAQKLSREHRAGRQADLPRRRLGAPAGVRLPGGRHRSIANAQVGCRRRSRRRTSTSA